MSETKQLLIEMEAYCREAGISMSTLSTKAYGNGIWHKGLAAGARAWPETIDRVRDYMSQNPPEQKRAGAA